MKKSIFVIGLVIAVGLIIFQPLQSKAGEVSKAYRSIQAVYTKIKVQQLNVQGKIWNKVGAVKIKDKLNVEKRARFETNIDVRGVVRNNGDNIVEIDDNLKVNQYAEIVDELRLGHIDFSVTDLSTINTSTLSGGDIFLSSTDFKLYLWNGTEWVDLTQQNTNTTYTAGTGLTLTGTEFTVNQGFSPTWTGDHKFTENVTLESVHPGIDLNTTASSGTAFNIQHDTSAGNDVLMIGTNGFASEDDIMYMFYPNYGSNFNYRTSRLQGGGTVVPSLSIATGGCATSDMVIFDGSPDLSEAKILQVFFDEVGNGFLITDIDDDNDTLEIQGDCTQDGSNDAYVYANSMTTGSGSTGINTMIPYAMLHVDNTLLLEPTAYASQPTCDNNHEGMMYYDDDLNIPCYCDGSSWYIFNGSPCSP